jgi:short subunit dehydrogenase-like uncharacterized protein
MAGRIVLLGATGYTGRLVAQALADRGARPLLAGRDPARLAPLAERLGGLETTKVDVSDTAAVRGLVGRGDVLVTTVGPFVRLGEPAVRAAAEAGARYLDSTGEPPFIRRVFGEFGPMAQRSGAALFTAFGYDFVPGNLAGALALRAAGPDATRVEVGYFVTGRPGFSKGTARSVVGLLGTTGFALRGGRVRDEVAGSRLGSFDVAGNRRDGISVGGSEHFALPRIHSGLSDVDVFVGWAGAGSRAVQRMSGLTAAVMRLPVVAGGVRALAGAVVESRADPEPGRNDACRTAVAARAMGAGGQALAEVTLDGPEPYLLTGGLLAWGAVTAAAGGVHGSGALGPADGFGLPELTAACADLGLRVTHLR